MHKAIVASELRGMGFTTKVSSIGIEVSLNRKVSKQEIEVALSQTFEEIQFSLDQTSKGVLVTL